MSNLIWFKQDLRIHDNPALYQACQETETGLIAVYLITPKLWRRHDDAAIKIEFWRQQLINLKDDLAELNIPLLVDTAEQAAEDTLLNYCQKYKIGKVFFNRNHEWDENLRDQAVLKKLQENSIDCDNFLDQCIINPGNLLNKQDKPYTIFTPFKKAWVERIQAESLRIYPKPKKQKALNIESNKIPEHIPGFVTSIDSKLWPSGETAALKRLKTFISERIRNYQKLRDFPYEDGTSCLSPYLTAGSISVKQCLVAALNANEGQFLSGNSGISTWISELIWREFYRHIMVNFPQVCKHEPFQAQTKQLRWDDSPKLLQAWQEGQTGIPIIDAAMRQLNQTGWMHNRLRMITAMFLTKNCFIDWRKGEKYFMQYLIDGDLASNNGGWQWSASTGTDAAPYFRIMNPVTQSQRFDPEGEFIKKFCPELASLDGKIIHDPHTLAPLLINGIDYPKPIVDLKSSRTAAIAKFKGLN